ncbi:hypothetical protein [Kangiella geojedonensis]|uniref:Periplasmic protein n=1 Tax=Kangiella geojedonensis TaxID=914150 RepID=A0A0F6TPY5_9GAMM|nr:hypothetical protein [Kangiella geojedonensis]AKE51732.1 hypothetical protein TQ33_0758 [Kangiella geojedonensis]
MIIKRIMLLSSLFVISTSLHAASTAEDCAAITDNNKRLECYDKFLKKQSEQRNQETPKPSQANAPEPAPAVTEAPEPELTVEEKFGSEGLKDPSKKPKSVDEISSRAIGIYKMWEKGIPVTLENGQVWEITDHRSTYHKVTNPMITIEKALFGSYLLGVEGLNKRFRVKRVQ